MGKKRIPHLESDEEAAEFWDSHSLADYIHDTEPADDVVFVMRPLKQISLRLAPSQIQRLKRIAAAEGIRYPSFPKTRIT